ncbi:MAG: hypothetical protein ACP6IP_03890 [Candidatus Njordarchaeia archaeon]
MISAIMILNRSGVPLYVKEFQPLAVEEEVSAGGDITTKSSVASMLVSAIMGLGEELFKGAVKYVNVLDKHLYIAAGDYIYVVVVSTVHNPELSSIVEEIMGKLKDAGVDSDIESINETLEKMIWNTVKPILVNVVPNIDSIRDIIAQINSLLVGVEDTFRIEVESFKPEKYKLTLADRIRLLFKRRVKFEELLSKFYEGDFEFVIKNASSLFGSEYDDYAKALYAKAGILLNTFDPKIAAPSLEEINTVVMEIREHLLTYLLEIELNRFNSPIALSQYMGMIGGLRNNILQELNKNDLGSEILAIVLSPMHSLGLNQVITEKLREKSKLLTAINESANSLVNLFVKPEENFSDWLNKWSKLINLLVSSETAETKIYEPLYFEQLVYETLRGLASNFMVAEDGLDFVERVCNIYKTKGRAFITDPSYAGVPNRNKALGIGFALGYLSLITLYKLNPEERANYVKEFLNDLIPLFKWLTSVGTANRDYLDYYYFYSALFLQVAARYIYEAGHVNKQLIKLVEEILSEDMVGSWAGNRFMNVMYLSNIILALANVALNIPTKNVKSNILLRLASYLETLSNLYASDMHIAKLFFDLELIRIYFLSESEVGMMRGRRILEELRKKASPLISYLLEKMAPM